MTETRLPFIVVYMDNGEKSEIIERLDVIIALLREVGKPEPLILKIANWFGLAVTILGILATVDILRNWIGG